MCGGTLQLYSAERELLVFDKGRIRIWSGCSVMSGADEVVNMVQVRGPCGKRRRSGRIVRSWTGMHSDVVVPANCRAARSMRGTWTQNVGQCL